jgi:hypothetical protein
MKSNPTPSIVRLVTHHGGPAALARMLDKPVPYQEIQRWCRRGWASPMHIFALEKFLVGEMKVQDLDNDRAAARAVSARRK